MATQRATPVIIGVGDIINRSRKLEDAIEPADLMLTSIETSLKDTGLSGRSLQKLRSSIDSISVVACWTWPYEDLPGLLGHKLGVKPSHKLYPESHGGNQPAKFCDDAAKRIALKHTKVAVVTGGEALASLTAFAKAGKLPPPGWTELKKDVSSVFSPTKRDLTSGIGRPHGIGAPIQVYPLFENGLRAHRGQSLKENNDESAILYGNFAKVAEQNPLAWNYGKPAETPESIGTVSEKNRMICFPYPLLMNAFNEVNIAGAVLLTSTGYAEELGIPQEKWIYPLGGAGTKDSPDFWQRPNFYTSPSIKKSLDAGLSVSGLTKDQIDVYDFYSCFPIVPKLACHHLGLSITAPQKPITLLGGLTSFGGAGNNYSMHAITETVRLIRKGEAQTGLILANGGVATYQHVICLSSRPRKNGPYPHQDVLPEVLEDEFEWNYDAQAEGEAVIETYTVDYDRDNKPKRGHVVGRLKSNGRRFIANNADSTTLEQLASTMEEQIGRSGTVKKDTEKNGRNLFTFAGITKL